MQKKIISYFKSNSNVGIHKRNAEFAGPFIPTSQKSLVSKLTRLMHTLQNNSYNINFVLSQWEVPNTFFKVIICIHLYNEVCCRMITSKI